MDRRVNASTDTSAWCSRRFSLTSVFTNFLQHLYLVHACMHTANSRISWDNLFLNVKTLHKRMDVEDMCISIRWCARVSAEAIAIANASRWLRVIITHSRLSLGKMLVSPTKYAEFESACRTHLRTCSRPSRKRQRWLERSSEVSERISKVVVINSSSDR
jgi:hypothetical protein